MNEYLNIVSDFSGFSILDIVTNLLVALTLGFIVANIYRRTHRGLTYSQSYVLTIVFISLITAAVLMVIGNSVARAFALVGALSIIRFRTVVKDTKDTAYIFLALVVGMASGTGAHFLGVILVAFFGVLAYALNYWNFGLPKGGDFILRFTTGDEFKFKEFEEFMTLFSDEYNMLHIEKINASGSLNYTYDLRLRERFEVDDILSKFKGFDGVEDVVIISNNSNIDF